MADLPEHRVGKAAAQRPSPPNPARLAIAACVGTRQLEQSLELVVTSLALAATRILLVIGSGVRVVADGILPAAERERGERATV